MKYLKPCLSILAFNLCMPVLHAQHSKTFFGQLKNKPHKTGYHSDSDTQPKATATGSRLIQEINLQSDGTNLLPVDSSSYVYSYNRGGDLQHTLKFDSGIVFNYNTPSYDIAYHGYQSFYPTDNIATSVFQSWNAISNHWENVDSFSYQYDANYNLIKTTTCEWNDISATWENISLDSSIYNINNREQSHTWLNWDNIANAWVNSEEENYTYMPFNKPATTIIKSWNTALNKWDSIANFHNVYDINNNIMLTFQQNFDFSMQLWINSDKDSFGYDAQNRMLSDLKFHWNDISSQYEKYTLTTYSNFSGNSPQTEVLQQWNPSTLAFDNLTRTTNTYNAFEQLTFYFTETWLANNWTSTPSDQGGRYHYETYTLHIEPLSNSKGTAVIYPAPATDEINISVSWNETQACIINIADMQGRILCTRNISPASDFKTTIPVRNLTAGNYLIQINGTKGSIIQQLTIAP